VQLDRVALQLYTVRDETARDFAGTVRRVAEIGYQAVEFAGYGGLAASGIAALLRETGLKAASTHVGLVPLEKNLDAEIAYCQEIGCSFLVLPWLPPVMRNEQEFKQLMPRLNEWGSRCREQGITFCYHNHDFEFAQLNGQYMLDYLLDNTDPALVMLELDVYWASYAGVDPSTYIGKRPGRAQLIHMKDMTPQRTFAEVGDGTLNLASVAHVAREHGAQWLIVENDAPAMPSLESARRSLENLRAINV
jgi:sugar phosphate isomerase/epimerase